MTDAILIMRGLEEMYPELRYVERLRQCMEMYPTLNWGDAMSRGQITSKLWLIRKLIDHGPFNLGRVAICGGWVGILARMMLDYNTINVEKIHTMDLSAMATLAAKELNDEYLREGTLSATVADCYGVEYGERYDTVINTSCEHFENFDLWFKNVKAGTMVVLQSNDFVGIDDHVDCVFSEDELVDKAKLSTVRFKGSLSCYNYTRYMVIGVK
jgi:hypothetical protein